MQAKALGYNTSMSEFLRNNYVSLTVAMADETPTMHTDVPTLTLVDLLAQWCGALGFWMGLSAMTVFELIQLSHAFIRSCKLSTPVCLCV